MSVRVCSQPGCPVLVPTQGRCPDCARLADAARGRRQARGYDRHHDQGRAAAVHAATPATPCARCGLPLGDGYRAAHYDHTDDRTAYLGLSHPACNLAAGGRQGPW